MDYEMRILRDSRVNCFMKLAGPWAMGHGWAMG